jgi:hypothetical protein
LYDLAREAAYSRVFLAARQTARVGESGALEEEGVESDERVAPDGTVEGGCSGSRGAPYGAGLSSEPMS